MGERTDAFAHPSEPIVDEIQLDAAVKASTESAEPSHPLELACSEEHEPARPEIDRESIPESKPEANETEAAKSKVEPSSSVEDPTITLPPPDAESRDIATAAPPLPVVEPPASESNDSEQRLADSQLAESRLALQYPVPPDPLDRCDVAVEPTPDSELAETLAEVVEPEPTIAPLADEPATRATVHEPLSVLEALVERESDPAPEPVVEVALAADVASEPTKLVTSEPPSLLDGASVEDREPAQSELVRDFAADVGSASEIVDAPADAEIQENEPSLASIAGGEAEALACEVKPTVETEAVALVVSSFESTVVESPEPEAAMVVDPMEAVVPASTDTLAHLDAELRPRIASVDLIGEIDFDAPLLARLGSAVRAEYHRQHRAGRTHEEAAKAIWSFHGHACAAYLVAEATHRFRGGDLWSAVETRISVPGAILGPLFGRMFREFLEHHKKPRFDYVEGHVHLVPILLHAGIPDYCLPDLFDVLCEYVASMRGARERAKDLLAVWRADPAQIGGSGRLDRPALRFLFEGGRRAEDLLDRTLEAVANTVRRGAVPDDLAESLTPRFARAVESWWNRRERGIVGPERASRERVPSPRLTFDPWGVGIGLTLPDVSESFDPDDIVWRIEAGDSRFEIRGDQRRFDEGHEKTVALRRVARHVRVCLELNGEVVRQFEIPVLDSGGEMIAFRRRGGAWVDLNEPLPAEELWFLVKTPAGQEVAVLPKSLVFEVLPRLPEPFAEFRGVGVALEKRREVAIAGRKFEIDQRRRFIRLESDPAAPREDAAMSSTPLFLQQAPSIAIFAGGRDADRFQIELTPEPGSWPRETRMRNLEECSRSIHRDHDEWIVDLAGDELLGADACGTFRIEVWGNRVGDRDSCVLRIAPAFSVDWTDEPSVTLHGGGRMEDAVPAGESEASGILEYTLRTVDGEDRFRFRIERDVPDGQAYVPVHLVPPTVRFDLVGFERQFEVQWSREPRTVESGVFARVRPSLVVQGLSEDSESWLELRRDFDGHVIQHAATHSGKRRASNQARVDLAGFCDTIRDHRYGLTLWLIDLRGALRDEYRVVQFVDGDGIHPLASVPIFDEISETCLAVDLSWRLEQSFDALEVIVTMRTRPWLEAWTHRLDQRYEIGEHRTRIELARLDPGLYRVEIRPLDDWHAESATTSGRFLEFWVRGEAKRDPNADPIVAALDRMLLLAFEDPDAALPPLRDPGDLSADALVAITATWRAFDPKGGAVLATRIRAQLATLVQGVLEKRSAVLAETLVAAPVELDWRATTELLFAARLPYVIDASRSHECRERLHRSARADLLRRVPAFGLLLLVDPAVCGDVEHHADLSKSVGERRLAAFSKFLVRDTIRYRGRENKPTCQWIVESVTFVEIGFRIALEVLVNCQRHGDHVALWVDQDGTAIGAPPGESERLLEPRTGKGSPELLALTAIARNLSVPREEYDKLQRALRQAQVGGDLPNWCDLAMANFTPAAYVAAGSALWLRARVRLRSQGKSPADRGLTDAELADALARIAAEDPESATRALEQAELVLACDRKFRITNALFSSRPRQVESAHED